MKRRMKHFGEWLWLGVSAIVVLAAIMAVSLWETVVLGRSPDEQVEGL